MLYAAAESVLRVPYLLNGMDTAGWDCRGLVAWCRNMWLNLPSPSMDGWYPVEQANDPRFVERAIQERIESWEQIEIRPGAVALFSAGERVSHVGIMLDSHNFLHARQNYNTCADTLQNRKWLRRFKGAYELR